VSAEQTIREALRDRRELALSYEGDGDGTRIVHAQVLYLSANGEPLLDCYQLRGPSASGGPLPAWRTFELAKIRRVELGAGGVRAAPGLELASPKYRHGVQAHV
jgi:hypothetical protein